MDVNSRYELYEITRELQKIIDELDDIAYGLDKNFTGIGSEECADSVSTVASKYRAVKRKLDNIDTKKVTDEFAAQNHASGSGGGGGYAF